MDLCHLRADGKLRTICLGQVDMQTKFSSCKWRDFDRRIPSEFKKTSDGTPLNSFHPDLKQETFETRQELVKEPYKYLKEQNDQILDADAKSEDDPTPDEQRCAILAYRAKRWRDQYRNKQTKQPLLIAEMSFSDLLHLCKNLAMRDFKDTGFAFRISCHFCKVSLLELQSRMLRTHHPL